MLGGDFFVWHLIFIGKIRLTNSTQLSSIFGGGLSGPGPEVLHEFYLRVLLVDSSLIFLFFLGGKIKCNPNQHDQ
jgi:hypothetical protein